MPGPGAYNPSVDPVREKVKNTVFTSRPKDKNSSQSPSPGDYHYEQGSDKPKYSFGLKTTH